MASRSRSDSDPQFPLPTRQLRQEQDEADLCMEPLPDLARSVLDFFRHQSAAIDSVLDVTAAFNLSHPERPPVPQMELWEEGMIPLLDRGWLWRCAGGWQLTEAGQRAKP